MQTVIMKIYHVINDTELEPTGETFEITIDDDGVADLSAVDARLEELNQYGYEYCASV